ncbi:MAG: alpha/beta fold hydrolase [Prevotellaceae bacterium]|jgi:pimeloyl-ACP methyl ester carboxylesterase|nr:alpha/beta fold hydrolase [Prevotellaceae bacterium]
MPRFVIYISILFLNLCFIPVSLRAQEANEGKVRAERLMQFFLHDRGDSLYAHISDKVRSQVSPETMNGILATLERQVGKYQSHGEWQVMEVSGRTIYNSGVRYERMTLYLNILFDENGDWMTFYFSPVPMRPTDKPTLRNDSLMIETELTVVCDTIRLPGTLTLPKNVTKPPVVVLVHGSGANDRDETVSANKPFRDIAWGLAERGIAVLRYDKRTHVYPRSVRDWDEETVDDALAAIRLLSGRTDVDTENIFLIGHSQGAMCAPRIAEKAGDVLAGIVMLASPARPLEDLLLEQVKYLASLSADTSAAERQVQEIERQVANVKALGTSAYVDSIGLPLGADENYFSFLRRYDPVRTAEGLTIPMYIMQGARDYQVTMEDFLLWQEAMRSHPNATLRAYPHLNHLLQEGEGKAVPDEYMRETPVATYLIQDVAEWIKTNQRKRNF